MAHSGLKQKGNQQTREYKFVFKPETHPGCFPEAKEKEYIHSFTCECLYISLVGDCDGCKPKFFGYPFYRWVWGRCAKCLHVFEPPDYPSTTIGMPGESICNKCS